MLETLLLLAQAPRINYCAYRVPVVVCVKWQERYPIHTNIAPKYFVKLTNGGTEMQVNRCTHLGNKVGKPFRHIPNEKWCPDEK